VEAVREQSHIDGVEKALKDPKKTVIVQTAPSVRTSIGEEFGLPPGTNLTTKLFTAYRKLGFDKVFDVNMGADITTMVEAEELVERIKENKPLPMFTSCCPGWVKYVEFYHPELFKNLTTARSPQMHSGGAYKFWWAKKMGLDPKNVVVVSTMPCTSKKYEARNKDMYINGIAPVDYSLTTRELAVMLKKHKIDLPKLKPGKLDHYGIYSGAAAIYGASGGVMESALRTAYQMLTGKDMPRLEIKKVRGIEGIKKASIKIGGKTLKVAIAATPKNAAKIIAELKKDPDAYHYIEVMACPGGCIGGGGQPIPSTMKIVAKRIEGLYKIDSSMKMRKAHENPIVKEYMDFLETRPKKLKHELLHRGYSKKKKFE
ncbi:ferredoxin, partial [Candidatus Peregrinibacteria bacterium]|nr:ferredoxin [Candidatus Peregrinibacteria bacterium]